MLVPKALSWSGNGARCSSSIPFGAKSAQNIDILWVKYVRLQAPHSERHPPTKGGISFDILAIHFNLRGTLCSGGSTPLVMGGAPPFVVGSFIYFTPNINFWAIFELEISQQ